MGVSSRGDLRFIGDCSAVLYGAAVGGGKRAAHSSGAFLRVSVRHHRLAGFVLNDRPGSGPLPALNDSVDPRESAV